ncbi:MAG: DUF1643 domain-containing protein [Endomicrobiaceae bacterium]|nr:DUF1643 domain-containing protein [Endomicrobiaceae bacterium]
MWIYEKTNDNAARFVLGKIGKNPLICFGVNSSTANDKKLDRTLTQVEKNSEIKSNEFDGKLKSFDSWIMLNLYPQRETYPDNMHMELNERLHNENLKQIGKIFDDYPKATIWVAWGDLIMKRKFLIKCLKDIVKIVPSSVEWYHKGDSTEKGHPHHPLYLKRNSPFHKFDIDKYSNSLI